MSAAGPALAALAAVAGAVAGQALGASPARGTLVGAALCALAAGGVAVARVGAGGARRAFDGQGEAAARGAFVGRAVTEAGRQVVPILALTALVLLSAAAMQRALDGLDGTVAAAARRGDHVTATLRLVDDPRGPRFSARAVARVEDLRGRGSLVLLSANGDVAMRLRLLEAGESAAVTGRLRPLAGFDRRYRWRHVAAALDADDLLAVGSVRSPLLRAAAPLRDAVLAGGQYLAGDDRALVAGFLVGDDRHLAPGVARDFRDAGLSHLLAVSGANVALVLALAGPALRRLDLAARSAAAVGLIVVFAAVTRFEPSVLRASVMAGLGLVAVLLGRPAAARRLLALTVAALVLVDPFLVHSIGFRLSCAASAGIIVLGPIMVSRLRGPRWVREALATTAAAQIGVAPVALPVFGQLPLVALPANLLAAPAAAALTVYGMASSLVGTVADTAVDGFGAPLQWPTAMLAGYLRAMAALAARMPLEVGGTGMAAAILVAAGVVVTARRFKPEPESPPLRLPLPAPDLPPAPGDGRATPDRARGATGSAPPRR